MARSVVKIVLDKDDQPALFFERVYPIAEYKSALKQFAQERARALEFAHYEHGGGVTEGKYTILGVKI